MLQTNVKERDYQLKTPLEPRVNHKNRYLDVDQQVYIEMCQFMKNVRYLVKQRYKYFAVFQREIKATCLINISLQTVRAYETGFFRIVIYNWLFSIARFFKVDVHDMLTIDMQERDQLRSDQ